MNALNVRRVSAGSLVAVLALAVSGPARATIVVSNLDQDSAGFAELGTTLTTDYAQSFTTGPQGFVLTTIEAQLQAEDGFTDGVAYLLDDAGGSPGSLIAAFDFPSVPVFVETVLTFTPTSGPVLLDPGTSYWFAIGNRGDGPLAPRLFWSVVVNKDANGSGTFGAYGESPDLGSSWDLPPAGAVLTFKMQVNGTALAAVPEPSTLAMASVGLLCGLGAYRARPRRSDSL